MRLYVKQKVFSWRDKFNIYSEDGTVLYTAESQLFSIGRKLHLYDANGTEVAGVYQKIWTFLAKYVIMRDGKEAAVLAQKFSFLRPKYEIESLGWTVEGDFWAHEYAITREGKPVANLYKKWFTWGDTYCIDIADWVDPVLVLSVVIGIDAIMADAQNT